MDSGSSLYAVDDYYAQNDTSSRIDNSVYMRICMIYVLYSSNVIKVATDR